MKAGVCITALSLMATAGTAQQRVEPAPGYVVQFHQRSFDLSEYRRAVRQRVEPARLAEIVRGLERATQRDQAGFVEQLRSLGGRITQQWWLVNACAVEIDAGRRAQLARLPNVRSVQTDAVRRPQLVDAADNLHHGSAAANQLKDRSGNKITGVGSAVAVLDTGADADSGTKKRPHACFYPDGDPSKKGNGGIGGSLLLKALKLAGSVSADDRDGHGTAVAACVGANRWNRQTDVGTGVAPGTGIVALNITDRWGWSQDSWIVTGWQTIAALRLSHNIGAGNNSFSGSPKLDNIVQQALDSIAYNADMLICVSAGNTASYTAESQGAFNGLAVGSIDKTLKTRSAFSAIGPLHGTRRTYPDLTAVGNLLVLPLIDDESGKIKVGGTSYSAPMVAGAAALLRQAADRLDATALRAILLNTVQFRSANRNAYGLGSLRVDAAVSAALAGDVLPGTVRHDRRTARYSCQFRSPGLRRVTVAWMRTEFTSATTPNLNLRILDAQHREVGKDLNPENSYESVQFIASANTAYTAEIRWNNPPTGKGSVPFAIAGVRQHTAPTASALLPATITAYQPVDIEISGTGLATATEIHFDSTTVTEFTVLDDTRIRVSPPALMYIGQVAVRVKTPDGLTTARNLTVTGPGNPIFVGANSVTRPSAEQYEVFSGKRWQSLVLASNSNLPSSMANIYKLGIGNNWTSLIATVVYLSHDDRGVAVFGLNFPTSLPKATVYLQTLSVDPAAVTTPFPVSAVHPLIIN